jgi:hypothetical protein
MNTRTPGVLLVPDVARPLPLSSVRITGGPLKRAQDLDAEYLLKLVVPFGQPRREEIAKYEQFIDRVLWGGLQYNEGPNNMA